MTRINTILLQKISFLLIHKDISLPEAMFLEDIILGNKLNYFNTGKKNTIVLANGITEISKDQAFIAIQTLFKGGDKGDISTYSN